MPDLSSSVPISDAAGRAQAAIARASAATGVDFSYLLAEAKLESGLDPQAKATASSATGLYQFVSSTWLDTVERHGAEHGLDWAQAAITRSGGRATVSDPAARAQIMALRSDPETSALMAAELARDNAGDLTAFLGRAPGNDELYLAHFLGSAGAQTFLGALYRDPTASAAVLLPSAAVANPEIFRDGTRDRSLGEVMNLLHTRLAGAMEQGEPPTPAPQYAFSPPPPVTPPPAAQTPSMAETLRGTFGSGDGIGARATQRIASAYDRFRTFGL